MSQYSQIEYNDPIDEKNPTLQEYIKWKRFIREIPNTSYWRNFHIYAHFIFDDIKLNTQSSVAYQLNMKQAQLSPLMGILRFLKIERTGDHSPSVKSILSTSSKLLDKA